MAAASVDLSCALSDLLREGRKVEAILIEQIEGAIREGDDRRAIMLDAALQSVEQMLATTVGMRPKGPLGLGETDGD